MKKKILASLVLLTLVSFLVGVFIGYTSYQRILQSRIDAINSSVRTAALVFTSRLEAQFKQTGFYEEETLADQDRSVPGIPVRFFLKTSEVPQEYLKFLPEEYFPMVLKRDFKILMSIENPYQHSVTFWLIRPAGVIEKIPLLMDLPVQSTHK